ncbi:MAG TPA: HAD hydrolase family protein [Candidatus Saccharimonadales bacterium]|jgi:YrbI family 3-deoxy-D-manno-octulosonate 8-phosphate phosphatase|nr:HAD hydrolase family protein [Candidatus Saccharimonadales bacterium]
MKSQHNSAKVTILVSDIDGVLTDGYVWLDGGGNEMKRIFFRDVDALFDLHRNGFTVAFITGEQGAWVEMIKGRLPHKYFYSGCREKQKAVQEILALEGAERAALCYIGDGMSDVPAMEVAGVAVCPANGSMEALAAADVVLSVNGGQGAIVELARLLKSGALPGKASP